MRLLDIALKDLRQLVADWRTALFLVLMPIGSVENHGVHSPLMTDMCWALTICEGVARATGAICAPPIYAAYSRGHMAYPGSLNIRSEVLTDYIVDIARSLMYHGYKRFALVNGHRVANLPPILCAGNKIHHAYGAAVGIVDAGLIAYKEVGAIANSEKGSEHGGEAETSMVLAYRPELVDMSKAGKQPPCPNGAELEAFMTHQIMVFAPRSENNEASKETERHEYQHSPMESSQYATTEKGKQILEVVIKNAIAAVETLRGIDVTLKYVDIIPI